jgi:hypothetical protein
MELGESLTRDLPRILLSGLLPLRFRLRLPLLFLRGLLPLIVVGEAFLNRLAAAYLVIAYRRISPSVEDEEAVVKAKRGTAVGIDSICWMLFFITPLLLRREWVAEARRDNRRYSPSHIEYIAIY